MPKHRWAGTLARCADPPRAAHYLGLLRASAAEPAWEQAAPEPRRLLAALLSGSQALAESLVAHPEWLPTLLGPRQLAYARRKEGLAREVQEWLPALLAQGDYAAALARLRLFKQRELLRIGARDLARLGQLPDILQELSDLADVCLGAVYQTCGRQLVQAVGQPWHRDAQNRWRPTAFCILGLGKLGGQELNYSSDVDVLFVYDEEGVVSREPPRADAAAGSALSNHQFFKRLAETIVAEVSRVSPEGFLYRVDLRLRPEGPNGPLARSLASFETYYAQWGQTWERMMLIKARLVAGDPSLAGEFLEMIQPFRHPRSLGEPALREIALMKQRIEQEVVKAGEMDRNVKLGRGGIREIEFVAQTLQVLHAGRHPFLADPQTLPTLQKLVRYHLLSGAEAQALSTAYTFLREVEHRLQMENNLQTHTLPTSPEAGARLAKLMGYASVRAFNVALTHHRNHVRRVYEAQVASKLAEVRPALLPELEGRETEWKRLLADHRFRDPDHALRLVTAFVHGPGFGHVSARTVDFARQLLARLLALCPRPSRGSEPNAENAAGTSRPSLQPPALANPPGGDPQARLLSDPDRVLARLDSFIGAYGARALLFETWATNPSLFDLLVLLFDRSEFLAESAIRTPDMVDELELSGRLRRAKTTDQILAELRLGLTDADQHRWLRRYYQTELMRIGLRDILGLADVEQNLVELSSLAEACVRYALEVVLHRHRLASAPLAIIGLGKLGGGELNYGSDLDVMFVAGASPRALPRWQKLAVEFMDLLGRPTEFGTTFAIDARLRPDGEKGLLVNTLAAYEEYYRRRSQLWEVQALSRARPVAGDAGVGRRFAALVGVLTDFRAPQHAAAPAQDPAWRQQIARMRERIENERTPRGEEPLAIKTGAGGLMDAEFIAQAFCLAQGWHEPNTLRALERARDQQVLPQTQAALLIENYRRLRRVEAILRRWSYAGETVLPADPAPLYRVAVRCGFPTAAAFLAAVTRYRQNLRSVYDQVFRRP